jgi:uncharacterized repeat protein (TIGR03803 family)
MMKPLAQISFLRMLAALALAALFAAGSVAAASTEKVLYNLQPENQLPSSGLVSDPAGNLYGANGYGNIYELSPPATIGGAWTENTIFTFDGTDGAIPQASLILDSKGNLYGATSEGGTGNCSFTEPGCGVVFELSPPQQGSTWTETVLYNFQGGSDGSLPESPLIFDTAGNLYGSTYYGGDTNCTNENGLGCGVIFKLSPPTVQGGVWTEEVLHAFQGGQDGATPLGALVLHGTVLYGVTYAGGGSNCNSGCGIVFALDPTGKEAVIHRFVGPDGAGPVTLIANSSGTLFGVTLVGSGRSSWGAIFELTQGSDGKWAETLLYSFTGSSDGGYPTGIIADRAGNLYGTTEAGGNPAYCGWEPPYTGCGVAFKLALQGGVWTESVLHTFTGGTTTQNADGGLPKESLIFGKTGVLYGATMIGGTGLCYTSLGVDSGCGTVYALAP